ncbi:MAG: pyridoxamine 5'-phosphate oxidase family protein [Prevotellaceae bacterium]|jgi:nitroimidazol reductase NimA-like FMN-containing flavoprotein (pyridoxamine 5'-phosphate oxidase superfamily)|nr:pyridoxamine 5'-phosphate oxidase family protein [Prevotellaceae bacterium]
MRTYFITEKSEIEKIIAQCDICFVGMTATDGSPYVLPMNFGYIEGKIILHSAPEGTHLQHIAQNNKVCIAMNCGTQVRWQHPAVACSYRMESVSVVCKGAVSFVENDDDKVKYLNILCAHYSDRKFEYSAPAIRNVKVWLIEISQMTCKATGQKVKNL